MFSYTDSITEVISSHKQSNSNNNKNSNDSTTYHLPYRNAETETPSARWRN